jgi:hypothetical protein
VVEIEFFDEAMQMLAWRFDQPVHLRDEMETILCESHPCRDLGKKEMHVGGGNTFDVTEDGVMMVKGYNRLGWEIVPPGDKSLRFLKMNSIENK